MCFGSSSERDPSALNARPRPATPKPTSSKPNDMPQETYAPPPGPPPNYQHQNAAPVRHQEQYAPPPGPPPSQAPPPHNWQAAVPDTSLLPPPPIVGYQASPTNNASEAEARAAEQWLRTRPLAPPLQITDPAALLPSRTTFRSPPSFRGTIRALSPGRYHIATPPNSPDACLTSTQPLYAAQLLPARPRTLYFEAKLLSGSRRGGGGDVSLALGFLAAPYPPFRLPGWERASLAVHGDDGRRYVNDKWGGRDFTRPFKRGETVGIGMRFVPAADASGKAGVDQPPVYGEAPALAPRMNVEVFFTRDGKWEGGWDVHEERDAREDLPVTGLEGAHDLYAAVGTFDAVEFEVRFAVDDWLYKP